MGCDGGTIPRRVEMVKLKKKAEKADRDVELMAKWRHCALSCEALKQPIVVCELGRLYNKEALLLALLDKSSIPDLISHIRSWRDVTELQLTPNSGYTANDKADKYNDTQAAEYICPVTGLEMSGRYRFCFLRGCGCVISEKALKEAPSQNCHKCGRFFTSADVVVINGSEEDEKRQREAIEERRKKAKLAKRKRKAEALPVETTSSSNSEADKESPPTEKKMKLPPPSSETESTESPTTTNSTVNEEPSLAASDLEVTTEASSSSTPKQEASKVGSTKSNGGSRHRAGVKMSAKFNGMRQQAPSSSKLGAGSMATSVVKKATKEVNAFKTVADDPDARSTYKSLFNSGNEPRPKERTSNWVTFFPYH